MNKNDIVNGKIYKLCFDIAESKKKLFVASDKGSMLARLSYHETFVVLNQYDNPYEDLVLMQILTEAGVVGIAAIYAGEMELAAP